jgi:phage replication-related protein YjqB (UPF0714/DUF867 family)
MRITEVSIRRALASQEDLISHREHCSADPETLAVIGCTVGQQVRIVRSSGAFGVYTVSEIRQESSAGIVRMGLAGRQRLGTTAEFDGLVDSRVPHPALTENEAEAQSEFVERLVDDGAQSDLIVIAPHGGDIERHTDEQAERVAARLGATSWRCKGWKCGGGAFECWHTTSADIREASFPRLDSVISRGFGHAVAFHGFDASDILIGGTAPFALKEEIRTAIEAATAGSEIVVRIAQPDEKFGGDDPRNIVNRLTAGGANGIQIEQSQPARANYAAVIADAVAKVYETLLPSTPAPCD